MGLLIALYAETRYRPESHLFFKIELLGKNSRKHLRKARYALPGCFQNIKAAVSC